MAFGLPKIDVPAITQMFNDKFNQLIAMLQAILDELKSQHVTMQADEPVAPPPPDVPPPDAPPAP